MGDLGIIHSTLCRFGIFKVKYEYTAKNSMNETSVTRKTCSIFISHYLVIIECNNNT